MNEPAIREPGIDVSLDEGAESPNPPNDHLENPGAHWKMNLAPPLDGGDEDVDARDLTARFWEEVELLGDPLPEVRMTTVSASILGASAVTRITESAGPSRRIDLRMTATHSDLLEGGNRRAIALLSDRGVRVRVAPDGFPTMLVIGSRVGFVESNRADDATKLRVVRSPGMIDWMTRYQRALWDRAVGFSNLRDALGILDNDNQARAMYYLCSGMKDESAARCMGVSVRTYRRHVAGVMSALGASSRFKAGLRAHQLGLYRLCSEAGTGPKETASPLPDVPAQINWCF